MEHHVQSPSFHNNEIIERSDSTDDITTSPSRPTTASIVQDLTGQVFLEGAFAAAHGGFADVYRGLWYRCASDPSPQKVSVVHRDILIKSLL